MKIDIVTNKVEIFETIDTSDLRAPIVRTILINGKPVYTEQIQPQMDKNSTGNLKVFIDWLLGIEKELPDNDQVFINKIKGVRSQSTEPYKMGSAILPPENVEQ